MATQAIDLSAGLVPKQAAAAPTDAIDLSAGLVPKSQTPSLPNTSGNSVTSGVTDTLKGIGEGAVQSAGETIQSLPWIGKKIISPESMAAERAVFAPGSAAEKAGTYGGKIAEPVLEFVLGDDALKGVALADKVGLAGKITQIAAEHPYIGKLLQHGVAAARMGTVGTADALAHGATLPQALATGATTGIGGSVASAALDAAPQVVQKFINPFRRGPAISGDADTGIVGRLTQGENVAQPPAQAATRTALQGAGSDVGLNTVQGAGLRTAAQEPIAAIRAAKQGIYGQVDAAAGTDLKGLFDRMDKIEDAIDQTAPGSPEEARFEAQRTSLQQTIDDAKATAKSKGVDANKMLKQGDALHTRESALRELQKKVLQNPNIVNGNAAAGTPETLNLDSAIKTLQKMQDDTKYGAPRLEQAIGSKTGAKQFLDDLYASQRRGVRAVDAQQFAKTLGKTLGVGAGLAEGYELLRK